MIRSVLAPLSLLFVMTAFAADTTSVAPETTGPRLRAIPSAGYGTRLPKGSLGVRAPHFFASPSPDTTAPATISLKTYRPLPMNDLFRPQRVELSRFDCVVKGVGAGMQMGLFAGLLAKARKFWIDHSDDCHPGAFESTPALFRKMYIGRYGSVGEFPWFAVITSVSPS